MAMMRNCIMRLYTPPNQATISLQLKETMEMKAFDLSTYHIQLMRYAGRAGVDRNDMSQKRTWLDNLNNTALQGGLHELPTPAHNNGTRITKMYAQADEWLNT